MSTKFGKRITIKEAQDYFNAHEDVKKGIELTQTITQPSMQQQEIIAMAEAYNSSKNNAFIFSKQLVETLLNTESKSGKTADYLMVHFASKFEDGISNGIPFKKGEPTIVILGCINLDKEEIQDYNEKNNLNLPLDQDVFLSMDFDDPSAENPGGRSINIFPPPGISEPTVINFVIK